MKLILLTTDNYQTIFDAHSPSEMRELSINNRSLDESLAAASEAPVYFSSDFVSRAGSRCAIWIPLMGSFLKRRFDVSDWDKAANQFVPFSWK